MPALFGLGGGGTTINYPQQQGYGEALSESLKAQVDLLKGEGEFSGTGGMQRLLTEYEAPVRKTSAQIDTDVLETTLLGGNETFDESGRILEGYKTKEGKVIEGENPVVLYQFGTLSTSGANSGEYFVLKPGSKPQGFAGPPREEDILFRTDQPPYGTDVAAWNKGKKDFIDKIKDKGFIDDSQYESLVDQLGDSSSGLATKGFHKATVPNPKINIPDSAVPIYKKDEDGNEIVRTDLAGKTVRMGDGMVDLLGDNRDVEEFTTRKATEADVTAGLATEVGESITEATGDRRAGFDADDNFLGLSALAEDIQRGNLSRQREADLADVERLSDRYQDVMADYKPAATEGLQDARDLLAEQKENLTSSGGVITKPTGSTFADGLDGQTMTAAQVGQGPTLDASTSYTPSASVSGGTFDSGTSYTASQVADPLRLQAATSYDPSASVEGRGYTATAGVQGGNIGADTLRAALLADAEAALGQGLTERERRSIEQASRARQTASGRIFDPSSTIQEAQAVIEEDRNRQMQNRGFAQSALGQEADIQRDDLGRGLQAQMQNQAALNQAAQFGASQDMQAQLANQAARNQAAQFGVTAGLSQEALAAQQAQAKAMADASASNQASQFGVSAGLQQEATANQAGLQAQLANQAATNQARAAGLQAGLSQDAQQAQLDQASNLAQAELTQQANAFGAQSAQQAALANQAQQQQANQFGVGATMDAERLNETLRQQGLSNYINAVGNLARMEDQYMLDPFQALLGRGGGNALQQGQSVFGQAGYGLQSQPQYLNPEAGLGYISQMAANNSNMYGAQLAADASRTAGLYAGLGALGGGLLSNAGLFS